ncbi:hypothetical protein NSA47_12680 [Irregularibacter muris]|jgi:hypothetical protein|uniref:DUF340 domain-containing protein n=1 Tax=Irregularibacter muris TaxID=1796619 RepID=A0AAE3HJF6_9FIRM|nr:hypothetical protein [Irregularibacter muris]MCR1899828.1 hypothetical protein [Irregularibacter muris]
MEKLREDFSNIVGALLLSMLFSIVCNRVGYDTGIIKSLPGLLILVAISLAGYVLSYIVPIKKITAVLWVSLIAIFLSSPISPVSEQVIFHVGNVSLMSVVTPILAYAGVLVGKDWGKFRQLGLKAIIISIVVMAGTFLVSSLLGDFFMKIFG